MNFRQHNWIIIMFTYSSDKKNTASLDKALRLNDRYTRLLITLFVWAIRQWKNIMYKLHARLFIGSWSNSVSLPGVLRNKGAKEEYNVGSKGTWICYREQPDVDSFVDGQERGSKQIHYVKRGTNKGNLWEQKNTGQFWRGTREHESPKETPNSAAYPAKHTVLLLLLCSLCKAIRKDPRAYSTNKQDHVLHDNPRWKLTIILLLSRVGSTRWVQDAYAEGNSTCTSA